MKNAIKEIEIPNALTDPACKEVNDKLQYLQQKLSEHEKELTSLKAEQYRQQQARGTRDEATSAINKAMEMLTGQGEKDSLGQKLAQVAQNIHILEKAVHAQQGLLREAVREAGTRMALKIKPAHQDIVRRLMDAYQVIYAINQEEIALRDAMAEAGYSGAALPPMFMRGLDNPDDWNGNIQYYWMREAQAYVFTPEQLAVESARFAEMQRAACRQHAPLSPGYPLSTR